MSTSSPTSQVEVPSFPQSTPVLHGMQPQHDPTRPTRSPSGDPRTRGGGLSSGGTCGSVGQDSDLGKGLPLRMVRTQS